MLFNQKKLFLFTAVTVAVITALVACTSGSSESGKTPDVISQDNLVKRGEYLVTIAGCDDCHTPKKMGPMGPEPDMSLRLSCYRSALPFPKVDTNVIKQGWALVNPELTGWAGPWGASFTANITSDATGIGNWSFDQFKKAFQQGKWKGLDGTRPLMPPMPWQNYSHMVEDDVKAIFAYLKSTKPINNVEPPIKPFNSLP